MEIDVPIILWLLEKAAPLPPGLNSLTTMGSEPLPEDKFDDLLRLAGLKIFQPGENTTILVMGQEDWIPEAVNQLLDQRSGKHLRAYSQEMFTAYLVSGEDPLVDEELARYLAGDHPGLSYLQDVGFDWPTTVVGGRGKGKIDADLLPKSFLMYLGYMARARGPDLRKRHQILSYAYEQAQVPNFFPASYVADWGAPRTSARLKKIAYTIAYNCTLHKAQPRSSRQAIEKWEADLRWLKGEFYTGRYKFGWPSTAVG